MLGCLVLLFFLGGQIGSAFVHEHDGCALETHGPGCCLTISAVGTQVPPIAIEPAFTSVRFEAVPSTARLAASHALRTRSRAPPLI